MKKVMAVLLSAIMLLFGTACGTGTSERKGGETGNTAVLKESKEALPLTLKESSAMSVKLNSGYEMPVIGLGKRILKMKR